MATNGEMREMRREFSYEEIMEATNGSSPGLLIGKGSHGCVYRAVLAGGECVVAAKKPSAAGPSNLDNEIGILSSYRSRDIVNLVGVAARSGDCPILLLEYMPNGSLEDAIMGARPDPPEWPVAAIQVGRALAGLHRAGIIHRDVKSANILFDGGWRARLADFSLAVRADGPGRPAAGTMGYIDPEYTGPGQLGPGVDVFSFGVVLMEMSGGKRRAVEAGERGVAERMVEVTERCLRAEGRRPGMEEVVRELERAAARVWWSPAMGRVSRWCRRRCGRRSGGRRKNCLKGAID